MSLHPMVSLILIHLHFHTRKLMLNLPSVFFLKNKFEFETKRRITLELHLTTLVEYYKNLRIPRGMRPQSKPNMFFQDIAFRVKFEQTSNKNALDMFLLNIEFLGR